jgi:proteasome lid subunit RPN8/RPN11
MNYSIAPIIRRLLAPRHELACSWLLWGRLCSALRQRGRARTRESGAFLLGRLEPDGRRHITDYVLYDDLDPRCLDSGIVRFDGRHFGSLWAHCKARGLAVVADIHVHPGSADQSDSDRMHPMISQRGHIALILPNFAEPPLARAQVGIYVYQGAKQWTVIEPLLRANFFYIGI